MASQEWTEFVPIAVLANFWIEKFSSIVSRAEASTPIVCGPCSSRTRASPAAAVSSASSHVVGCSSPSSAADERLRQPVRVVDEVEGEAALDAEVALVRDVRRVGRDLDDPLRLGIDVQVDLAADAAVRARRLDLLEPALGRLRALLELLVDRAGRADGEAAAAQLALGVEPGEAVRGDDARVRPAALERKRRALHDLLRVAHAAVAEDARVGVVAHELVAVLVGLALRVREDERRLGADLLRHVDELVRPAARVRVQVLGEEHLRERACAAPGTSEFVETTMPLGRPGSRRRARGRGEPSTPTTHMRQPPYGSSLSSWQSVGTKTPWRAAAWTSSSPSGAVTVLPSSVNSTTRGHAAHRSRSTRPAVDPAAAR